MNRGRLVVCAAAAAATAIVSAGEPAWANIVRCQVRLGESDYAGPCAFTRDRGGSFSVAPVERVVFFSHSKRAPDVKAVAVLVKGSSAEVRGIATDDSETRWGEARRSHKDHACWIGDHFAICVY